MILGQAMRRDLSPEPDDLTHGLRLAGVAVATAVIVATLVIGIGEAVLDRGADAPPPPLIRTAG